MANCLGSRSVAIEAKNPDQYTNAQTNLMWDRWKQGESLHQVARLFDRRHSSIRGILAATDGFDRRFGADLGEFINDIFNASTNNVRYIEIRDFAPSLFLDFYRGGILRKFGRFCR